jgi:hypothetical protein
MAKPRRNKPTGNTSRQPVAPRPPARTQNSAARKVADAVAVAKDRAPVARAAALEGIQAPSANGGHDPLGDDVGSERDKLIAAHDELIGRSAFYADCAKAADRRQAEAEEKQGRLDADLAAVAAQREELEARLQAAVLAGCMARGAARGTRTNPDRSGS